MFALLGAGAGSPCFSYGFDTAGIVRMRRVCVITTDRLHVPIAECVNFKRIVVSCLLMTWREDLG